MDAVMKGLSISDGAYSAVLWRSVAGAGLSGSLFVLRGKRWPTQTALRLHAMRGLAGGGSVLLFFWGLARVPMAQGVALTFLAPLIALYLAAALLGETIRRAAIGGSLAAALGVLAIAAGEMHARASTEAVLGTVSIVAASLLYAYSLILLRQQAQVADPLEVTLFTSLVIGLLLLLAGPWLAHGPRLEQVPTVLGAAALGTVSSLLVAWAYARGETQLLAPTEYTAFVWSAILGYLVFGERVSGWTAAGALLIVAGCTLAVRRPIPASQTEASA